MPREMTASSPFEIPRRGLSGNRIKAGFHCHTIHSDGGLSVKATVDRYRAAGFACLGITDHRRVTAVDGLSDREFIAIKATENGGDPDLIGVGIETTAAPHLSLSERAHTIVEQGGVTIAAHPTYCGVLPGSYVACQDLMAMEIYNAYCDAAYANGYALELWDMVLGQGKRIWGVAGDDAHLNPRKRYYSDAGRGWIEIWAGSLTEKAILEAFKAGAFFSTQGPVFNAITVAEREIRVQCSPVKEVRWRTFGNVGYVEYADSNTPLTSASLPDGFLPRAYVRIELVDYQGKKAWSNPIFVAGGSVVARRP